MTKEDNNVAKGTESKASESPTSKPLATETPVVTEKLTAASREKPSTSIPKETIKSRPRASSRTGTHPIAPEPKSSGRVLTWIMLLLNLAFISTAIYAGYMGWQYWNSFTAEQTAQQQQIQSNLQSQLKAQFQSSTQAQEKALSDQLKNTHDVQEGQNQRIEEIYEMAQRLSGAQAGQWQLSEALFIVRMAGRKLWLEKDPMTAIMLLQQADQQLANIPDSRLISIRQKLASDIAALEAVNYITPTQKVLQLQGLYAQVESLIIMQPSELLMEQIPTQVPVGEITAMQKLKRWFQDNVFDVTRVDQPISPFISQKQQWLAREQLKYQLLVAQNALFQEQASIYDTSMKQSQSLLTQFFDMENSLSKSFIETLSQLEKHEFGSPYPENLSAERALNVLVNGTLNNGIINNGIINKDNKAPTPEISETQNPGGSLL